MLYPHFPENYLSCFKFAIFLPTNFSEEPLFSLGNTLAAPAWAAIFLDTGDLS